MRKQVAYISTSALLINIFSVTPFLTTNPCISLPKFKHFNSEQAGRIEETETEFGLTPSKTISLNAWIPNPGFPQLT
ncbi:hypothetical protein HanXRQr2_Chr07g0309291 [Helianthus annuus]|uniref:Uncharacterized protein n=1 Tax=Helianthus annuus TaxID=4232 RepID=A0A9K3NHN3_HELAN|nr:hypothetical protein HanXRQr2_Chr07g0309291 [Helianthus annuus]KAJ0905900.1 hypothetical protein HanPSC8_Chr07g0299351 [Helianthus annuus]